MIHVKCYKCGDEIEEDDNYGMAPDGNIACLECAVTLISEERDAAITTAKFWRESAARWKKLYWQMTISAVILLAAFALLVIEVTR